MSSTTTGADRRQEKAILEARKDGTLPPEIDKDGNLINPHVPEFMAKAPWYLQQEAGSGLAHQRRGGVTGASHAPADQSISALEGLYKRGATSGRATVFRKGACQNCGSMTHKEKECTDRPRKVGARYTNADIRSDEVLPESVKLGWDAKRDAYAGYDAAEHKATIERFEANEEERRRIKAQQLLLEEEAIAKAKKDRQNAREEKKKIKAAAKADAKLTLSSSSSGKVEKRDVVDEDAVTDSDAGEGTDDNDDASSTHSEDNQQRDEDGNNVDGGPGGPQGKGTRGMDAKMKTWNVRVREDTAKYLLNLDTESAFYDPKTRAMRENPFPDKKPGVDVIYAGDNVWKASGAVSSIAESQLFAWDAASHGADVHLQANPTQAALMKEQFEQRKAAVKELQRKRLLEQYGGGSTASSSSSLSSSSSTISTLGAQSSSSGALHRPPQATDAYVEYGLDGRPIISNRSVLDSATSSLSSNVDPALHFLNGHSSCWGSFFDKETMRWGYACCKSLEYAMECSAKVVEQEGGPELKRAKVQIES